MYAVAPPNRASSHIQNTAPGPPITIAMATPATLPVPTREAAEMVKARKADTPSAFSSSDCFARTERIISGSIRNWTPRVRTVKRTPAITRRAITTYQ